MKRRIWVFSAIEIFAALALLAAACAGDGNKPAPQAQQQPAPPVQPAPAAPAPEPARAPAPPPTAAPKPVASPGTAVPQPRYGGILRMGHDADPPNAFDTLRSSTIRLHAIASSLDGDGNLVKPCRENVFKVCPGLAESWEANKDFTQWTFKIRDGAFWHDGTPFTAQDAKFWVDLAFYGAESGGKRRAPAFFKAVLGQIKKVETLDGNKLVVTLERPEPSYVEGLMATRQKNAHPKHLMQPRIEKGEVSVSPQDIGWVAAGPFKMLNYEKGSRVQVRRFDRYWEKDTEGRRLPFLEGINFAIIPDTTAADAAFRVGHLDGGGRGTGHELDKARRAKYVQDLGDRVWFAEIKGGISGLGFNVLRPGPWQNAQVRKAISLWMDKQASIEPLSGGFGFITTILNPENPFTSPDFITWPGFNPATKEKDRAEAKRLMREAGYENGFPMGHLCRRAQIPECEFFHAQLAGLGIDLKLHLVDDAGWLAGRLSLDYDTEYGGSTRAFLPELTEEWLTRRSISNSAVPKHEDPKVAAFYDKLRAATSFNLKAELFRELERYLILDQAYFIPVYGGTTVVPYRSHVKGLFVPIEEPRNNLDFATVWLDK